MIVVCECVEYDVGISFTESHEFVPLTIVFAVEYEYIFVWNLRKSPNDGIDTLGVGES
jgi:hypothetical protein